MQKEEVLKAEWLLPSEAMQILTFESTKRVLKKAMEDLKMD